MGPRELYSKRVSAGEQRDGEVRLRRLLEQAAAEWRTTFDAISSPIVCLDVFGRVRRLNRAARDLAGRSYQEMIGQPLGSLPGGVLFARAAELARAVHAGQPAASAQIEDREAGTVWDVAVQFRGADPEATEDLVIVVARDITRLVELQASLRRSERMSALGALVAGVAHQMRNPLFGISAALDAFESRFGDREEMRRYAEALREPVGRLGELLRDLLEYSKPVGESRAPVDVIEVLATAVRHCLPIAAKHPAELLPPAGTSCIVLIDQSRVQQAFTNLIENAVQFSPAGGRVETSVETASEGGQAWVRCRVRDHGPGIRGEDLPLLTEPFFSRRHGGTGLGLALVQRVVLENGGKLHLGNALGGGAEAIVSFPCAREDQEG